MRIFVAQKYMMMKDKTAKYEAIEEVPASVHDDTELAYTTRSGFKPMSEEVGLVDAPQLPPYTMEELNARIDEAEVISWISGTCAANLLA